MISRTSVLPAPFSKVGHAPTNPRDADREAWSWLGWPGMCDLWDDELSNPSGYEGWKEPFEKIQTNILWTLALRRNHGASHKDRIWLQRVHQFAHRRWRWRSRRAVGRGSEGPVFWWKVSSFFRITGISMVKNYQFPRWFVCLECWVCGLLILVDVTRSAEVLSKWLSPSYLDLEQLKAWVVVSWRFLQRDMFKSLETECFGLER